MKMATLASHTALWATRAGARAEKRLAGGGPPRTRQLLKMFIDRWLHRNYDTTPPGGVTPPRLAGRGRGAVRRLGWLDVLVGGVRGGCAAAGAGGAGRRGERESRAERGTDIMWRRLNAWRRGGEEAAKEPRWPPVLVLCAPIFTLI
jgi:hypothetical protein